MSNKNNKTTSNVPSELPANVKGAWCQSWYVTLGPRGEVKSTQLINYTNARKQKAGTFALVI